VSSSESRTFHERLIAEICGLLSDTSRARSASSPVGQIATHSSTNEGSPEILILALLEESDRHGYEIRAADRNQRGINDYTALYLAVGEQYLPAIERLSEAGADPTLRTRIDDCETAREMAERAGLREIAELLAKWEERRTGV